MSDRASTIFQIPRLHTQVWYNNLDPSLFHKKLVSVVSRCSARSRMSNYIPLCCVDITAASSVNTFTLHEHYITRVSCQKGPTRHAYAWRIGPFWQVPSISNNRFLICKKPCVMWFQVATFPQTGHMEEGLPLLDTAGSLRAHQSYLETGKTKRKQDLETTKRKPDSGQTNQNVCRIFKQHNET